MRFWNHLIRYRWTPQLALSAAVGLYLALMGPMTEFARSIGRPDLPDITLPPVDLYQAAEGWSEAARQVYLTRIAPLDVLFPLALGLVLASLLIRLAPTSRLALLGPLAVLLDWAENLSFVVILNTPDTPVAGLAFLAQALTLFKFAAYAMGVVTLLTLSLRHMSQNR